MAASSPPTNSGAGKPGSFSDVPSRSADEFSRETEEAAARPLLARANLLRLRGQWNEAIAVCTDALRHAPRSPSAHSLLGEVYEAQGKTDEAVQWFGMACDLDPTNQSDRAKLDNALAAQQAKFAAAQKAAGFVSPPTPPKHATEKTLEWIDRILPPGKSQSVARLIFALCGVLALMILVAAGILWQTGRNANQLPMVQSLPGNPNAGRSGASALPPLTTTPPVVVATPRTNGVPAPTARTAANGVAAAAQAAPVPQIGQSNPARAGAENADIASVARAFAALSAANTQVSPTLSLQAAQVDPVRSVVRLDVSVQMVPGESIEQTRERVLRGGVLAVRAASEANIRAAVGVVHVHLQAASKDRLTDAFTGTLPLSVARDMNAWGSAPADLSSRFTALSWSPAFGTAPVAVPNAPFPANANEAAPVSRP